MTPNQRFWTFLSTAVLWALLSFDSLSNESAYRTDQANVPAALQAEIAREYPSKRILNAKDISDDDCEKGANDHPGWVEGRFRGGEFIDYAALLLETQAKGQRFFNGREYKEHDFVLVAFLRNSDGSFTNVTLRQFSENVPSIKGVILDTRRNAVDVQTGKTTPLPYPTFRLYSCGQFEIIYTWTGVRFAEITISQ